MKFCTSCGFKMEDNVKFCPKCGAEQEMVTSNNVGSANEVGSSMASTQFKSQASFNSKFKLGQPEHLSFTQSLSYIFSNMFNFNPQVADNQKSIFWWNFLLATVISMVFTPVFQSISYFAYLIFNTGVLFLTVASCMRRLNYLGRDKDIAWLSIVPIAAIYPLILMFFNRKEN